MKQLQHHPAEQWSQLAPAQEPPAPHFGQTQPQNWLQVHRTALQLWLPLLNGPASSLSVVAVDGDVNYINRETAGIAVQHLDEVTPLGKRGVKAPKARGQRCSDTGQCDGIARAPVAGGLQLHGGGINAETDLCTNSCCWYTDHFLSVRAERRTCAEGRG